MGICVKRRARFLVYLALASALFVAYVSTQHRHDGSHGTRKNTAADARLRDTSKAADDYVVNDDDVIVRRRKPEVNGKIDDAPGAREDDEPEGGAVIVRRRKPEVNGKIDDAPGARDDDELEGGDGVESDTTSNEDSGDAFDGRRVSGAGEGGNGLHGATTDNDEFGIPQAKGANGVGAARDSARKGDSNKLNGFNADLESNPDAIVNGNAIGNAYNGNDNINRGRANANDRVEFDSPIGLGADRKLAPFAQPQQLSGGADKVDAAIANLPPGTLVKELGNQVENPSFEEVLASNQRINTHGWWTDGKTWERVECAPGMPCPGQSLGVGCSPQFIRGAYQFLPIQNEAAAGVEISALISGRGMTAILPPQKSLFGLMVIVTYASGVTETHRISVDQETFDSTGGNVSQTVAQRIAFRNGEVVSSVLIMLTCFGYKGNAWFDDISALPTIHTASRGMIGRGYINDPPDNFPVLGAKKKLFQKELSKANLKKVQAELDTARGVTTKSDGRVDADKMVTLVTHGTFDRLESMLLSFKEWDGPIAVALYGTRGMRTAGADGASAYKSEWAIAEETTRQMAKDPRLNAVAHKLSLMLVVGDEGEEYPINRLRNEARKLVKTGFVLMVDADFVPSPASCRSFFDALGVIGEQRQSEGSPQQGGQGERADGTSGGDWTRTTAFVVPAFEPVLLPRGKLGPNARAVPTEITWPGGKMVAPALMPEDYPRSKEDLAEHVRGGRMQQFQFKQKIDAHGATNYERWLLSGAEPYDVDFGRPDYNVYNYEPYVIVRVSPSLPQFDERFSGFGMNKVSFLIELSAAGYMFTVLPNNWLVHVPHPETNLLADFQMDVEKRALNRVRRYEFLSNLLNKYRPRKRMDLDTIDLPDDIKALL